MTDLRSSIELVNSEFILSAQLVTWDSEVFNFAVAQIRQLKISRQTEAELLYPPFVEWRDDCSVILVSCRLPQESLNESMFLEQKGFRFIEMVLHPILEGLGHISFPDDTLTIEEADKKDISRIKNIAENAFNSERYHADPRVSSKYGDLRYGRWVENSYINQQQKLLKIEDNGSLVGFFIIEIIDEVSAYWHLTAIAPAYRGQGYGKRAWMAMLKYHVEEGINSISTTISARNTPVLNLYSQLRFRFLPPEMTFHWIRS